MLEELLRAYLATAAARPSFARDTSITQRAPCFRMTQAIPPGKSCKERQSPVRLQGDWRSPLLEKAQTLSASQDGSMLSFLRRFFAAFHLRHLLGHSGCVLSPCHVIHRERSEHVVRIVPRPVLLCIVVSHL